LSNLSKSAHTKRRTENATPLSALEKWDCKTLRGKSAITPPTIRHDLRVMPNRLAITAASGAESAPKLAATNRPAATNGVRSAKYWARKSADECQSPTTRPIAYSTTKEAALR
jgi:hypothetical protein